MQMIGARGGLPKFAQSTSGAGAALAVNFGGIVDYISQVAQSTSPPYLQYNRVGANVRLQELELSYTWGTPGTFADQYATCRLLVVQWLKEAPGNALPSTGDILDAAAIGDVTAPHASLDYFHGPHGGHNFKVIYDHTDTIAVAGIGSATHRVRIPLKGVMSYSGPSGVVADSTANGLFLCAISDSGAIPDPLLTYVSRVWFVDEP
jgi:hypothetical protein